MAVTNLDRVNIINCESVLDQNPVLDFEGTCHALFECIKDFLRIHVVITDRKIGLRSSSSTPRDMHN